jgi:alcohol dehydrogenase, propanol-preferring
MQAMVLERPGAPLKLVESSEPRPAIGEVRVRVAACGVCRTDLHVVDGELPNPKLPIVPGHEIVGRIEMVGDGVNALNVGQRVGVPWLGRTCGQCRYCRDGRENLCDRPLFTGYTRDGGYATHAVADARYVFALPEDEDDVAAAPLLCAGLIGWRSLHIAGDGAKLGLYGFGAAAHIIAQVARWQGRDVFVVCAGIHMSDIPSFPYNILWQEREIKSVANLTRQDGEEFFKIVPKARIQTQTTSYPLVRANEALADLRSGRLHGAAVLVP